MKKSVRLLSLLGMLLFSGLTWGQIGGVDTRLVEWEKDSVWFVNNNFMPDFFPEYDLKLIIPGIDPGSGFTKGKILWGDVPGEAWSPDWDLNGEKTLTHNYLTGSFEIQIGLWKGPDYSGVPDSIQRRFIFNQNLDVKFELLGPNRTCLPKNTVDTFIVHLTDMPNPKGTVYEIDVFAKNDGIFWGYDSLYRAEPVPNSSDSVYLIFKQPTGLDGVSVSIRMKYEEGEDSGISLENLSGSLPLFLYQSPNLEEIFHFSSIADTVKSFKICAPGAPGEFWYDSYFLRKYQYPNPSSGNPNYDKRTNFQVKYYYTDSVYTDIPDGEWRDVSTNTDYVDSVKMLFKTAGFYRLFITASNQCGTKILPGGVREYFADTLRTDSIKGKADRRYIQVYENAQDKLFCLNNDVLCINRKDTVWLVDRNQRKAYDPPARYEFETVDKETHVVTNDACRNVATEVYKDGKRLSGDISNLGCDSTVVKLVFTKPGNYAVTWSRLTDNCDKKISKSFDFHVGDVPEFVRDTIWKDIFEEYSDKYAGYTVGSDRYFTFCDTFKYTLPDCRDLLDSNYVQVDSFGFLFTRGSYDTVVLKTAGQQVFAFDSLGEKPNYISLRAKNECGWGYADTVKFFTHEMPHVQLLRDSIINNDTLCAGFPYRYYLGGILPKSHGDSIWFTGQKQFGSVLVENPLKWQPLNKTVPMTNPNPGKFQEKILVVNLKAPVCRQELGPLDLYVVKAPSSVIYQDSILYCELKEKLETRYLFNVAAGDTIFNRVEWNWNNNPVAGKFPILDLKRNGNDTLRFKTSTGNGCYMADTLVFIPKPLPKPDLDLLAERCVPDTIKNYLDFMGSGNNMLVADGSLREGMTLKVYKNRIVSDSLLYDSYRSGSLKEFVFTKKTADSVRLYYVMTDTLPDAGFAGCEKTDSITIYVFKPKLDVFRNDTLPVGIFTYNCPSPFGKHVDTCDMAGALTWSYGVLNCDIADAAYQFDFTADQSKDSVALILSGTTRCGDPIQDSLIIYIPHSRLAGYRDTICSNTAGYKLWGAGKTTGNFIDTTTLEWKIIENPGGKDLGSFSSAGGTAALGQGASVIFTPGADAPGTNVKIEVTGNEGGSGGIGAKDTVYLWVNPAPVYTWNSPDIKKDTLIIDNYLAVSVSKIDRIRPQNYTGLSFVKQYGAITCTDSLVNFRQADANVNAVRNLTGGAKIQVKGLKGCSSVLTSDTVRFLFPVNVLPAFKNDQYGICQGDEIGLDSLFTFVRGYDRYTDYSWELISGTGQFNADSTTFKPTNALARLKLTAYKNYTIYDRTGVTGVRSGKDTVSLLMYAQPSIQIKNGMDQDTLCNNIAGMNWGNYLGQWLTVTPAYLKDSLRVNGKRLSQYGFSKPAGKTDTLVLTVEMKGCTKWDATVKDSVFLYRLPKMISGDFTFPLAICEVSRPEIDLTGLTIAPEAKNTYWKSNGGSVTADVPAKFIPTPGRKGKASLTLHVQPPKGCPEDTLRKEFSVYRMPIVTLEPDTVCRIPGDVAFVVVGQQLASFVTNISTIEWYRKNENPLIGTTSETNPFSYTVTRQDSVAGFVDLVAKISAKAPCSAGFTYDTVRIVLQDMPEITFVSPLPKICQGNPLTLSGLVTVSGGYENPRWIASVGAINSEQTQYFPGDNTGDVRLTYRVEGNKKCAGLVKSATSLPILINAAPVPTITKSPAMLCSRDSIIFNASASLPVNSYSWNFGEGIDRVGSQVKYGFAGAGNFAVTLTATYSGNGCSRSNTEVLTIHEKPVANFLLPKSQIAVGFEITCKNTSTPLSGVSSTWDTDEDHSIATDFTTSFSTEKVYDIKLKVQTAQGCWDTITKRIDVVAPPKASFNLDVDPCTGDVTFNNTSELHNSQVRWDFGDGNITDVEAPAPKVYERYYDDTTFMVTLTLTNAAGVASAQKPVKLVSRLEPAVELLPEPEGCHQLVRYLLNKTKGRPDTTTINWGDGHLSGFKGKIDAPLFSHRFENESTAVTRHTIRLVTENVCKKDSVEAVITVHPVNAKAVLGISNAAKYRSQCFGFDWGFLNRSFGFGGTGYKAEWTFEAGVTKQLGSPLDTLIEHSFAEPGHYTVRLRVEDKCNWDTVSQVIRVKGNNKLSMNVENKPYCSGQGIGMTAVQQGTYEFSNFVWDFGDGRGAQGKTVTHVYTDPKDAYRVKLSATADDCPSNDVYYSVNVHRTPGAVIVMADSVGCAPFKIGVRGVDNNHLSPAPAVLWDFRNGAYSGKAVDSVIFAQSGVYNIKLKMTSDAGCIDTATRKVSVLYTPRISFSVSDSLFCTDNGNFEVSLTNTSPDMQTCNFNWWQDGLLITNNNNPDKLVFTNASGPIVLKLTATHQESGCPSEFSKTIVSSSRVSSAFDIDVENMCAETPVVFTSNSEHATRLMWLLGDGTFSREKEFSHSFRKTGDYLVKLISSNEDGCRDSVEKMFTVYPLPTADFSWERDNSLTGLPDTITVPKTNNGGIKFINYSSVSPADWGTALEYLWNFGDSTIVSGEISPRHLFANNGLYKVWLTVKTVYGCVDSISDLIKIDAVTGLFIPTAFAPQTDDPGTNRFEPKGIGLHSYKIQVYSPTGNCVWSSDKVVDGHPAEFWDGKFNGGDAPKGNYIWRASAIFIDGGVWDKGGSVILIR